MVGFETEQQIRAMAAMRIGNFEDWVGSKPVGDNFGELPWLEIVTAASMALIAVDNHLKAADGVIDRLSKLYKWLIKKQPADEQAPVTLAERIIVTLADERARRGAGLTVEQLAARTMIPADKLAPELKRLRGLSIAIEANANWTLRVASD